VVRIEKLAGDASSRRYLRLHLRGAEAPPSVVVMVLPEDAPLSDELTGDGAAPRELPFVNMQRYLARNGIPVPALLLAREREHHALLLEDIGNETLAEAVTDPGRAPGEALALLRGAVATLARFATLILQPDPDCIAFAHTYDRQLIGRELEVTEVYGLAESDHGPPRVAGADAELCRALARLGDAMAAQARVLMHRDYHAWNLHVDARGLLRVIDFQDALVGPALYDLASLCTDRDTDRFLSPLREADLIEDFAEELARLGLDLYRGERKRLERDYFTAVVYRTLRVIGRFRFLAIEKQKPSYLAYLPRMARQTLRALDRLEDRTLAPLLRARSPHFA
jgi:aminoglycoside/choline kinase family phosphotransferase